MDHIFGDSHDIDFGSGVTSDTSSMKPVGSSYNKQDRTSYSKNTSHKQSPRMSSHNGVRAPREARSATRSSQPSEPAFIDTTPALARLIAGMKSSFLPREEDITSVRIVSLSSSIDTDPLFLIRQDDTTILLGSGFGNTIRAGREYPTFPDMRLIFSEKEHIRAWILTDASIDVAQFELILPTLGFPPIYATRDIIAKFRNNIKNTTFLESCRFFELFADGTTSRRIGDIECVVAESATLGFRAGGSLFNFSHISLAGSELGISVPLTFSLGTDGFLFNKESFVTGEVLSLKSGKISRNTMKFTFDTFYVDGLSIGVVAGYALGDREQLAENGVLTFTLEEDSRVRTIAGHIFIDSRGFVHAYEMMYIHKEILKGIRSSYEKFLTENPKIERGELVQGLRREITKYCYLLTGRTPVVMPIVIER